jgi:AcrR family transcriptional regulator
MYHAVLGQNPRFAEIADTGDIVDDLLAVLSTNAAGFRDQRVRELISNLLADAIRDEALATMLREQYFGPRADAIAARVRAGVERGELAPTVDADIVPALLTGPLQYLMIVRGSDLADSDLRRVVLGVVGAHLRSNDGATSKE